MYRSESRTIGKLLKMCLETPEVWLYRWLMRIPCMNRERDGDAFGAKSSHGELVAFIGRDELTGRAGWSHRGDEFTGRSSCPHQ